ncbi:MAG TPA: hypothetical protein VGQ44_09135 [Gemmatimonadaceae bacterium]|jgi:hypothetical protein|nr:hypothetical protein [Gemmatimonadaceae bacterium]
MRRVALLILLGGCASSGSTPEGYNPKPAVIYAGDQSNARLEAERPHPSTVTIAADPAIVWAAAKQAYASLEIPLGIENPTAHTLGNQNFYKSRTLAGESMTLFVDCGQGMTGAKAASYRIYMSLITNVSGDGKGGTTVQVTFSALGQDVTEGSTDRIPCGSTGHLEQLVLDKTKAGVALR